MTVRCRYPGSASQIVIGLLIAFLSMQVYTYSRPYIADADDNLANVGNAQIILVFIASLMLFIKDMDEQDGAPGDMFKGPIFSYAMIVIGTLAVRKSNHFYNSRRVNVEVQLIKKFAPSVQVDVYEPRFAGSEPATSLFHQSKPMRYTILTRSS